MITHTIESYWIPSQKRQNQSYKFKWLAKLHFSNFEINFIRYTPSEVAWCENTKWIRQVLLKIPIGHDSVHRRTDGRTADGQTDKMKPVYTPFNLGEVRGVMSPLFSERFTSFNSSAFVEASNCDFRCLISSNCSIVEHYLRRAYHGLTILH